PGERMRRTPLKRIAAALLSVAVSTACAQKNASAPNRWTLTNGIVSRTIAFDADHGLITQSWKNLIDRKEFIDPQQQTMDSYCREFRFSMNGRAYTATPSQFAVTHATESTDSAGAHHLDLGLASHDHRVGVAVHYILPAGATGIRQFLSIRNDAAQSAVLSQLSIACEPIAPAQPVD